MFCVCVYKYIYVYIFTYNLDCDYLPEICNILLYLKKNQKHVKNGIYDMLRLDLWKYTSVAEEGKKYRLL